MAIVISGVNNNDKITASDGTIDLLSGVNFNSELTVPSFKVGNNIQLGNAGVATATTFVGNLTGNVNATSNLLLQIGGSEKFRVGSSGQLGIAGANYGTSGQVLTSGGSGSAATWSTISGTTINNNANYRLISGDANANELNAESNLTWNGSKLLVGATSSHAGNLVVKSADSSANQVWVIGRSSDNTGSVSFRDNGDSAYTGRIEVNNTSGMMFQVGSTDRLQMDTAGQVLPAADNAQNLGSSSKRWKNIYSADLHCSNKGSKNDVDGTWGDYTIQEGESDLFLINNRSGKKYKFNLTEVN